jgi:beta-galactosidase GanA
MIADLQAKYESIERLNDAWGTEHASWHALAEHQQPPPDRQRAQTDLQAFATRIADQYFEVCRQAVKNSRRTPVSRLPVRLGERPSRPIRCQVLRCDRL